MSGSGTRTCRLLPGPVISVLWVLSPTLHCVSTCPPVLSPVNCQVKPCLGNSKKKGGGIINKPPVCLCCYLMSSSLFRRASSHRKKLEEAQNGFCPTAFRGGTALPMPWFRLLPPELWENKFLLFSTIQFMVLFSQPYNTNTRGLT